MGQMQRSNRIARICSDEGQWSWSGSRKKCKTVLGGNRRILSRIDSVADAADCDEAFEPR